VNPAYNDWVIFSIPLTALQASNISLGGVVFATTVPGTFYLDKIELTEGFLRFPLDCSNASCSGVGVVDYRTKGAYTINSVTSVHDHSMKVNTSNGFYPYGDSASTLDGDVVAWTGEIGRGTPATPWCYPKVGGGSFSLKGTYIGTTSDGCTPAGGMNYDDHPGYDYKAEIGTPVKAVASGIVVSINNGNAVGVERCYIGNLGDTCDKWGAVGIDHGNGYVTQYLHMQISSITLSPGNPVTAGQIIGTSGQTSPPSRPVGPHLHFEVLKKVPGLTSGTYVYKMVDPYGFYADGQDDPLMQIGAPSFLLWK
jgi:murein DD-endopeptidase MepM/ murein hydrolase activator NlpD